MKDNGSTTRSMAMEFTYGLTDASTTANGIITICPATVSISTLME